MTEVTKKLKVDFSRKATVRPTFSVQNDNGARNLIISLYDDGAPYKIQEGTTSYLNYKRPDGVSCALLASVGESEVSVSLNPAVLGAAGLTECTVSLIGADGSKLTSSDFCLDVAEELYAGESIAEAPELSLLDGIFARLSGFESEESKRVSAEEERVVNENERLAAERDRVAAEVKREVARKEFEEKITDRLNEQDEKTTQRFRVQDEAITQRFNEQDERLSMLTNGGGSVVLAASAWSGEREQVITLSGLGEHDLVMFYPESARDREVCGNYGVFVNPDSDGGSFKVTAKAKPLSDVSLKYYIIRGSLPEISEVE